MEEKRSSFSTNFVASFARVWLSLWRASSPVRLSSTLCTLLALTLAQTYVVSWTGKVVGGFYTTIPQHDRAGFLQVLWLATIVVVLSALIDATLKALVEWIAWQLRSSLCTVMHRDYFSGTRHYDVLGVVDNPDQRITQDAENWAATLASVVAQTISAPAIVVYYSVATGVQIGWYAPLVIYAWFGIGYAVNRLILAPTAAVVFRQERLEGNYRFGHARVRTWAETIAMYRGANVERRDSDHRFARLMRNSLRLVRWHWGLNTSSNFFSYVTTVLNYVVVALPVLFIDGGDDKASDDSAGYIATASFNIIMLTSGFSTFINAAVDLSNLAGLTARIDQLLSELKSDAAVCQAPSVHGGDDDSVPLLFAAELGTDDNDVNESDAAEPTDEHRLLVNDDVGHITFVDDRIEFCDVCCQTPDGKPLLEHVSFAVRDGERTLLMGESGCGKTSLVRTLNGLWAPSAGEICRPRLTSASMHRHMSIGNDTDDDDDDDGDDNGGIDDDEHENRGIFFLPQRPYLTHGSLADQLSYPVVGDDRLTLDAMWRLLELVRLGPLMLRHEQTRSANECDDQLIAWTDLLSPGEQQRLSFARMLYHRPRFAVLDEATSSLDRDTEAHLYSVARRMNIAVLSVGHRTSLLALHDRVIRVAQDGSLQSL
jgi:ATP-binding cassette, subfamily D (ALD), member 4